MTNEPDLSPDLAALAGLAAAHESEHAAGTAAPEPPPAQPSAESLALAQLALHTLGIVLAKGFGSAHWMFSDAELATITPPWATILDLYLPTAGSPWFAVAVSTGPLLYVRIAQQRAIDAARAQDTHGGVTVEGSATDAQEYGPPPSGLG